MTSETEFVNKFWGQQDAGFQVIQSRLKNSLSTLQELLHFYKEKIAFDREYNKKFDKLLQTTTLGSGETGSLKMALEKLQIESGNMVNQSNKFIRSVSLLNYEKLHNFYQIYHRNVIKIEAHMQKVLSRKRDYFTHLQATKEKYRSDCNQIKTLKLLCQTTWGRELDKNTAKLQKLTQTNESVRKSYHQAVDKCSEIHEIWVRDWAIALLNVYQLEIERIQICKLNCFSFCNNVASLCVDWDQSVDMARTSLAKVGAPKDVHDFAGAYGTGNKINHAPKFVDYLNGFDDDGERSSEFTVAEFVDPEFSHILSRTFSMQSGISTGSPPKKGDFDSRQSPTIGSNYSGSPVRKSGSPSKAAEKALPAIKEPLVPPTPATFKVNNTPNFEISELSPDKLGLRKQPSQNSAYTSGPDDNADVFDRRSNLHDSHGLDYSNPTNYTSQTGRSWASPRRKERLAHEVQEQINRKLREMTGALPEPVQPAPQKNVPITKDFSIDFIAKALEDLNAGGNGDVSQFRHSVRAASQLPSQETFVQTMPASDYVDDSSEVATRYDSISFRSPDRTRPQAEKPAAARPRPKSMVDTALGFSADDLTGTIVRNVKPQRSLLKSPTKSYVNLNSLVSKVTPVTHRKYDTKARATYTYNSRENGELSFRKGWHMYVVHKQEDNWYMCELGENCGANRGKVGLVPYNYVVEGDDIF